MRRSTRFGTVLFTSLLGSLIVTAPAEAAAAGKARVSGTRVLYTAAKGAQNRVVVTRTGNRITVDDRVAIKAGAGCKAVKGDRTRVVCRTAAAPTRIRIATGDRVDTIVNRTGLGMTADGGTGGDTISGGPGADILRGGSGSDRLYGYGGSDIFYGGTGADRVNGGGGQDFIRGQSGDDVLLGAGGDDFLAGELGADRLDGGSGNDSLRGDDPGLGRVAADVLRGGPGRDSAVYATYLNTVTVDLDGSARDDGQAGEHDTVGADVEDIYSGYGNDRLTGNASANRFDGGMGDDVLRGGAGDDLLIGLDGRDSIYGEAGDDEIGDLDVDGDLLDGGAHATLGDRCVVSGPDTTVGCER
ncbi:calcium-binding protein [Actinoplanes hulinensis]|uniref:Calcium-binding protein n=1 Tax=Actinoplanes hulinensis TaxID=1144547 RepID=A0ABS7BB03_9ACTN|nr:calcium-binding protein [Actinoplanes hulinensis]MBW6438253.1 calcium-binding protein [Actinoplanes hulinensis]